MSRWAGRPGWTGDVPGPVLRVRPVDGSGGVHVGDGPGVRGAGVLVAVRAVSPVVAVDG